MRIDHQRYRDERLPRYTSYPTAPHFSADVGAAQYEAWLASLGADAIGSLYLHVPFCRSMCWYCGCHTTITKHDAPILDYLTVMRREIETSRRATRTSSRGLPHPLRWWHADHHEVG